MLLCHSVIAWLVQFSISQQDCMVYTYSWGYWASESSHWHYFLELVILLFKSSTTQCFIFTSFHIAIIILFIIYLFLLIYHCILSNYLYLYYSLPIIGILLMLFGFLFSSFILFSRFYDWVLNINTNFLSYCHDYQLALSLLINLWNIYFVFQRAIYIIHLIIHLYYPLIEFWIFH